MYNKIADVYIYRKFKMSFDRGIHYSLLKPTFIGIQKLSACISCTKKQSNEILSSK